MVDIVPELLEQIKREYAEEISQSKVLKEVNDRIINKTVTYADVNKASQEVGDILADVYKHNLTESVLPDGKMYFNIANRIVGTTLTEAHEEIADVAEEAQNVLNKGAGLGLKAIRPTANEDRIKSIINGLSNATDFGTIERILDSTVKNYCQSIVDESIMANAEFQYKAGLKPKIIRKSTGHCCEWCNEIAGTYSYPNVPKDVYRRHDNCRCTVEYDPGSGKKRQDVWSKEWKYEKEPDKIEERKELRGADRSDAYQEIMRGLNVNNIQYNEVLNLSKKLDDNEIISRLSGGDMTKGSCSSLAFAYIGNKNGMDVLDFRGGGSQTFFAQQNNIKKIFELPGVKGNITRVQKEAVDAAKIINSLEKGKEYYFFAGKHAAIIRNTEQGAEYLELQSPFQDENGWTSFDKHGSTVKTLQERFKCRKTAKKKKIGGKTVIFERNIGLVEADSFQGNEEFKKILGYINTDANKQQKGVIGNVK